MDKKFLHRVIDQLVNETRVDHNTRRLHIPFPGFLFPFSSSLYLSHSFISHCENVYGLNEEEIKYVFNEYRKIINYKINNGL